MRARILIASACAALTLAAYSAAALAQAKHPSRPKFLRDEVAKNPAFVEQQLHDICASIQHTLVNMLLNRLQQASAQTGIKTIAIAGGVSANLGLRKRLQAMGDVSGWDIFIPEFQYCTDNAAMIAMVAHMALY